MTSAALKKKLTHLLTRRPSPAQLGGPLATPDDCRPVRVSGVAESEAGTMSLRVRRLRQEADGVVSVLLVDPAGGALPAWTAGAHLELQLPSGRVRHYSLCGDPDDRSSYLVAVLREADGRGGSIEVHDSLRIGSHVEVRGPRNHFAVTDAPDYVLIAGGIGITPILSMARHLKGRRPWHLYYGGRSRRFMAFVSEAEQLAGGDGTVDIRPSDELGRLDLNSILRRVTEESALYCCGPEGLLSAVQQKCHELGIADRLHLERFSAPSAPDAVVESAPVEDGFDVELVQSGRTIRVEPHVTTLDALRTVLPKLPSECETGICGTCEVPVLGGVPEHHDFVLSESEREAGSSMLICVSRSRTPKLLLDL